MEGRKKKEALKKKEERGEKNHRDSLPVLLYGIIVDGEKKREEGK